MDRDVERRLNRIEGMLTKLLVQCSVSEKIAGMALDKAQAAIIEIKAFKDSTHEVKYIPQREYDEAFGSQAASSEDHEESYGPPEKSRSLPDSLRSEAAMIWETDASDDELNDSFGPEAPQKREPSKIEEAN